MSLEARGNVNAGALDRRVRLDYPLTSRTDDGGESVTWVTAASVWASVEVNRGGKLYAAEATHFEAGLTYRIRARNDLRAGWRLVHGDDVFEITAITELGRSHFQELTVRAIDQTPHTAVTALLLHDGTPFVLHTGEAFTLHREQDLAA
jgi:SPP1 family predicted phage head-tail adaptor